MRNIAPWIACSECSAPIVVLEKYIQDYFNGNEVICGNCEASIDWWNAVKKAITNNFMLTQAFSCIGAKSTIIEIHLKRGTRTHYKMSEHGIPKTAKILSVNYSPEYGLFPLELTGNVVTNNARYDDVTVYPMPMSSIEGEEKITEGKTNVFITWIEHSTKESSWKNLIAAFEAYANGEFNAAIIPANVAVENTLSGVLYRYVSRYIGNERVELFLDNAATYSHQLNVVLPLIVSMKKLPILNDTIRGLLNKLRGYRNNIAHEGEPCDELEKKELAEMLCASLFAFYYINYIDSELQQM